ncbi:MAG TPA: SMP-30/gluconolactonase/LRE family protein [Thermoanaerobaculia bacterium]|nr:SMP-30/gluconolactonase/LRE family protein [Thermoanaerobaculia bacterium]
MAKLIVRLGSPGAAALAILAGTLLAATACRARETPQAGAPEAAAAPTPDPTAPVVVANAGFATPESVLYDAEADVYLVSNINGGPTDVDANGFISRVDPAGRVLELKWIDGSKPEQALDAPKGMAFSDGLLYVADLTSVRTFDRATGKATGRVTIPGATFLNDVAAAPDGSIYVSDSGLKAGARGLEPNGSDGIYRIPKGGSKADRVIKHKGLGNPNGLLADAEGVWVVTFGSGEIYRVSREGRKESGENLPTGQLDGIVQTADGSVLVSSWEGGSILRGLPGAGFLASITGVASPADIGYDSKRKRLLIPLFTGDAVEFRTLAPAAVTPAP